MNAVPVDLQFPVGTIDNPVVTSLLVELRRVPVEGEAIDFDEDAGIDPRLDGRSFAVKHVNWPITQRAPGINKPPIVVVR